MENLTGQIIKGYELEERIGTGGFGAVYRARQTTVEREVAVKIILPGFANRPDFIRRFEAEAQTIASLEHLHITPLYDFWRDPEGAYLVMRFLRGGSLRDSLRQGPYDLAPAAVLLDQVASALAMAHRSEIIHRDIKPGNILLDEDGNAYLADFGISKVMGSLPSDLTEAGLVGSLEYISPEQARSEPVTPQTDIYSLGVVLYELLTGEHPFPESSPVESLYKHLNSPLPEIDSFNGEGEAINAVIQKATAKNPAQRFADALEMAAEFRRALNLERTTQEVERLVELLTMREQEVLQLIVEGKSNREIAQDLVVTVSTVKWYVNQIYRKLGVRNRVQAIVRARELNLIITGSVSESISVESPSVSLPEPENPYKGLRAFQAADHRHFFGRQALIQKLLSRLSVKGKQGLGDGGGRFLAVVGPSGSGKSSVVKAGLIPALWRGDLPGSERWFVVEMVPGDQPLDELEVALMKVATDQAGNLHEPLTRDARGLRRVSRLILPEDDSELVVVIDQFEELFTFVEDEDERVRFLDLLLTAVQGARSRVRVIVTLRADFFDRPLHYQEFGELLRENMVTILPLSAEELSQAIQKPAEIAGVTLEEGLVPTIIDEIHYQPGALPLLQYALTELFDRREGRLLTRQAYQDMGGTIGALAKRAEEIYENLSSEGQGAARQIFLRLVTLGEGVEDTRRRTPRSELLAITPGLNGGEKSGIDFIDEIIDTYAAYRLLSLDHDPATRAPMVEVAHEAILREWERLRGWLNHSREDIRLQRQLARVAEEWRKAGKDSSFLLHGARLEQFETWSQEMELVLTPGEQAFLDASFQERDRQAAAEIKRQAREARLETRSRNFLRALVGVFAVATVVAVVLSVFAFNQQGLAQEEAERAATQQAIAEGNADLAATSAAEAQAEALARATAQANAEEQKAIAEQQADFAATQQAIAEEQARLATSRELSQFALANIESDPHLSLLLAYQALQTAYTRSAEEALRQAIPASRLQLFLPGESAVFSPDWSLMAVRGLEGEIQIREAENGIELQNWKAHTTDIQMIAFSPDGTMIATCAEDGSLKVWDTANGELLMTLAGHEQWYTSLVFSPDGGHIATGNADDTIRLWPIRSALEDGRETLEASMIISTPLIRFLQSSHVEFASAGASLVTSDPGGQIRVWDIDSQELLHAFEAEGFSYFALSSDGSTLAATGTVSSLFGVIQIWDLKASMAAGSPQIIKTLLDDSVSFDVKISPDGRRLATTNNLSITTLWDLESEEGEALMRLLPSRGPLSFNSDGSRLATRLDGVQVWDITPGGEKELLTIVGPPGVGYKRLEYSPDGTRIGGAGNDGAYVWDAATGELVLDFPLSKAVWGIAFSPDGQLIATAGEDNIVRIISAGSGEELFALSGHLEAQPLGGVFAGVIQVAFSPDGQRLASAGADGLVKVWDSQTGEELLSLVAHPDSGAANVIFSPDGTLLAASTDTPAARAVIWDAATGQELVKMDLPQRTWGLTFSPDNMQLVTSGQAGFLSVWDVESGQENFQLTGLTGTVHDVRFSPDGRFLYTDGDGSTLIWDFENKVELLALPLADGSIAISPDGKRAAVAVGSKVRIYTLDIDELFDIALEDMARWFTAEECQEFLHVETCPPAPWVEEGS